MCHLSRWLRLDFQKVTNDHLRGLLLTAAEIGYSKVAELAADTLLSREDITDADRWQAYGVLEARARTTTRRLEILEKIRPLAAALKADEGMLDVGELRIHLQRGDQPALLKVLDRIRRDHSQNPRVSNAVMQVFAEAGIDLGAMAAAGAVLLLAPVLVLVLLPHRLARSLLQLQSLENSGRQVASHHQVVEMKNPQSGLPDTTVRPCSLPLTKC